MKDRRLIELVPSLTVMFVIAAVLGLFYFKIDPALQQILPLEQWPISAKVMHYLTPVYVFSITCAALGLMIGVFSPVMRRYFTHRQTVAVMAMLGILCCFAVFWSVGPLVGQLLNLRG